MGKLCERSNKANVFLGGGYYVIDRQKFFFFVRFIVRRQQYLWCTSLHVRVVEGGEDRELEFCESAAVGLGTCTISHFLVLFLSSLPYFQFLFFHFSPFLLSNRCVALAGVVDRTNIWGGGEIPD